MVDMNEGTFKSVYVHLTFKRLFIASFHRRLMFYLALLELYKNLFSSVALKSFCKQNRFLESHFI